MRVPRAPCTARSAGRAQDCSVTMALHVTASASDGEKEVAVLWAQWVRLHSAVPFLFEAVTTCLPVNIVAFKRVKQRKGL